NIAAILGRCCVASASRSPRWSVWAWVRKIASSRAMVFSSSGHHGFVITQGSISATCPDDVVRENVLWPKYVIRFPLVLSTLNLERKTAASAGTGISRSEEHTSELQSRFDLVCRLLLEKKK